MISVQDLFVHTHRGRLFVRTWNPGVEVCSKAPIILFHDSLGCVELWRDFPERLAAALQRQVIAYDRLGFGRSEAHPGKLATDFVHTEADGDFRAVLDGAGVEEFIAFGHSVGGGMAVAVAAAYPSRCIALITESAQAFVEDVTRAGIVKASATFAQPGQLSRLEKYHGAKAGWVLRAWVDTWLSSEFAAWNLDQDLRRVRCPAMALHGDRDEYGSIVHPRRISELTGGTAMILDRCGHVPHREHADLVIEKVKGWLSDVLAFGGARDAKSSQ